MMLKSMTFALTWGKILLCSHLSSTAAYSLKLEILPNCEVASLTVFTTMCPEEQQTIDNLTTVLSLKYLMNLALVVSLGDV